MARRMAILLVFLAGCGVSMDLSPNDALRQACPPLTDVDIVTVLLAIEDLRQAGIPFGDVVEETEMSCGDDSACRECFLAAANQIFRP